jgi:hypothetical protein
MLMYFTAVLENSTRHTVLPASEIQALACGALLDPPLPHNRPCCVEWLP